MILVRLEAALSYFRTNDGIVLVLVKPQKVGTTSINLEVCWALCEERFLCSYGYGHTTNLLPVYMWCEYMKFIINSGLNLIIFSVWSLQLLGSSLVHYLSSSHNCKDHTLKINLLPKEICSIEHCVYFLVFCSDIFG